MKPILAAGLLSLGLTGCVYGAPGYYGSSYGSGYSTGYYSGGDGGVY